MASFISKVASLILLIHLKQISARCPDVTTKPDFDVTRYVGDWYEQYVFNTTFSEGYKCVRARYTDYGNATIGVLNTGITPEGLFDGINGTASQPDPQEPGRLNVFFAGRPAGEYLVLDTDYLNFSSVYACDEFLSFTFEFAWILTRETAISPEVERQAMQAFQQFGINTTNFFKTQQGGDCEYRPT